MPKTLAELKDAKRNVKRAGGKKVDFTPILAKILSSGVYYTKREVWASADLVNRKVSLFRTKKLLDNAVKGRRLTRLYTDGKFYYGKLEAQIPAPAPIPAKPQA